MLRIEDTDRERSTQSSDVAIRESLKWLGLHWDEGPDIGGEFGPYRSSERLEIYQEYVQKLIQSGGAFHCFCSRERLDAVRTQQRKERKVPKYDGHCLSLAPEEVKKKIESGQSYVIRLKVPNEGECTVIDKVRREIKFPWNQIDMQILMKSDGYPTYHLAATVDDHLMRITHIFRGEEWISSCPKHKLICDYLGWELPELYHLPLLRNPDQSKMSKRKQTTSINYFRMRGFFPGALLNYLATMGWSMPDEREEFSMNEFREAFDPSRLSTSGPVFDVEKLSWLNGKYIRNLSLSEFKEKLFDWSFGDSRAEMLLSMLHNRTETLDEVFGQADYLLGDRREVTAESFEHKSLTQEECKRVLHFVRQFLDSLDRWDRDLIFEGAKELSKKLDLKFRDFLFPLFVSISGKPVSLPLFDSMVLLGSDVSKARIRSSIEALGGISKKQLKRLDKEWAELTMME